jgi:hypothetical protein
MKGSIRPDRLEINLLMKLILPMSYWSSLFIVGGTIVLTASWPGNLGIDQPIHQMRISSGSSWFQTSWFTQKLGIDPHVPPNQCGLDYYIVDADLHQLVDQIMIDVIHGALVRGVGILQPKGHDHVFEQSHGTGYSECSLVYVFWATKIWL